MKSNLLLWDHLEKILISTGKKFWKRYMPSTLSWNQKLILMYLWWKMVKFAKDVSHSTLDFSDLKRLAYRWKMSLEGFKRRRSLTYARNGSERLTMNWVQMRKTKKSLKSIKKTHMSLMRLSKKLIFKLIRNSQNSISPKMPKNSMLSRWKEFIVEIWYQH